MKKTTFGITGLVALVVAVAAASQPAGPAQPQPAQGPKQPDLTQPLADVLAGKVGLENVRLDARWANPNNGGSGVRMYGNGIGLWNNQIQFQLAKAEVLELLKKLEKGNFTRMPPSFGGLKFPGPGPKPGIPEILKGEITLTINGVSQSVMQSGHGDQSKEFAELAISLINACVEPAKKGTSAASLADGLQKIGQKKLDPLTLSLLVHRIQGEGVGPDGWLMRVEGQTVTLQVKSVKGYAPEIRHDLSRPELENLLKLLLDNDAGNLPVNLYADHYTDFTVAVLGKEKNLQARKFAGMTPQTHGEKQKQFDRIFTALEQLSQQVLKKGTPGKK